MSGKILYEPEPTKLKHYCRPIEEAGRNFPIGTVWICTECNQLWELTPGPTAFTPNYKFWERIDFVNLSSEAKDAIWTTWS